MEVRRSWIAGALFLFAAGLLAQATGTTTGDVRGRVADQEGAALPGVVVSATSQDRGLARSDTSLSDGSFTIRLLPPGLYGVSAELSGFQPVRLDNVRVTVGSSTNVELVLRLAGVAEAVTVRAETDLIDPASTEVSKTIGEQKIRNLPINARNFLEFALTTPGVTVERGPQSGAASTSGLSINGQSPRYNNVVVDGLDNNDSAVGSVRSTFSQEAVQEYQVIQSPFSSEYGKTAGGIVNIVTRSGSNDLHGSAFYFYRDDGLSEENPLTGTKTPFKQNQYGASLGGPILRDRLFFFGAAERLDITDANVVTISDAAVAVIRAAGFDVRNGVVPYAKERSTFLAKLDLVPGSGSAFALRGTYSKERDENQQAWGGLVARSNGGVRDIQDTAIALTGTSILSANLSNELRALWSDRSHQLESLDPNRSPQVTILGVATFGTQRFLPQPRDTQVYQVFDAVSYFRGKSAYKVGVDYTHTDFEGSLPLNFAGLYRFGALPGTLPGLPPTGLTALQAFGAGIPQVFAQGFGDPVGGGKTNQIGAFAQGEWNFTDRFLVRAGLRYEYEDPIDPFPSDSNNWAPRLSFSWSGGDTWRLRGGAGRFYGVASLGPMFAVGIQDGVNVRTLVRVLGVGPASFSPLVPWMLPGRRFDSLAQAGGALVPLTVLRPEGCVGATPPNLNIEGCAKFESAYTDQANLGFEVELAKRLLLNLDYLHARGRNIFVARNVNPVINGGPRPNPTFSDIYQYESNGNSWYDGYTVGLQTRIGGPFEMSAYYTYADSEDDYVDWLTEFQLQNTLDPGGERGPSAHTPKHTATISAIYTTAGRDYSWWARDWTVSTIANYIKGRPFNILAGFDRNLNGDPLSDRPAGVSRNSGELKDLINVDLRVARRVSIGPVGLEAIFEVFNLLNRENVLEVNNVRFANATLAPNPAFGDTTRVADPRRIQLGARLTF
ncbi:MAG: TonB-dependent receptor [Acidobacteriota bacterium]|nr:TonB-dependent receptor [Acidobacteriota bacterium]